MICKCKKMKMKKIPSTVIFILFFSLPYLVFLFNTISPPPNLVIYKFRPPFLSGREGEETIMQMASIAVPM